MLEKIITSGLRYVMAGIFVLGILLINGCSDKNSITSAGYGSGNESLSILATDNSGANPPHHHDIKITSAKALVTKLEILKIGETQYQQVSISPFVLYFADNGTVKQMANLTLEPSAYSRLKFEIHKPNATEPIPDPDFRTGANDNQRFSLIITGTYDGRPFTIKLKRSFVVTVDANNKIIITRNHRGNITMLINRFLWFRLNGDDLNPCDGDHDDIIQQNITSSFTAVFTDDNGDGQPDGGQ